MFRIARPGSSYFTMNQMVGKVSVKTDDYSYLVSIPPKVPSASPSPHSPHALEEWPFLSQKTSKLFKQLKRLKRTKSLIQKPDEQKKRFRMTKESVPLAEICLHCQFE